MANRKLDLDKLRGFELGVVQKLTGGTGQLAKARKINYIQGRATFVNNKTLSIQTEKGEEKLTFDKAILATGRRPASFPVFQIDSAARDGFDRSCFCSKALPEKLLVMGGGYIGLELGSVYAALVQQVNVVEATPGLLPGADRDLVAILQKRLEASFEEYLARYQSRRNQRRRRRRHSRQIRGQTRGRSRFRQIARSPLDAAQISRISVWKTPKSSRTNADLFRSMSQRQTVEPHIYAIGDIAGDPMLAHKASHEGRIAVEAHRRSQSRIGASAIPAVIFTDPEIAWAGLTETAAAKAGKRVKVAKFPWAASGRAVTLDRTDGLTKLILDPETDRVLGVGIAGSGAGELIAEGTLAIEMGALADDLRTSPFTRIQRFRKP